MNNGGVLAQQGADLPVTLPWYFGLAIVAVWVVLLAGIVGLVRRQLQQRAARRAEDERRASRSIRGGPPARR